MQEISLSLLALVGIALLAMFFGYGFGLFEGRGQGYKRRQKEEATDPALKPIVPPAPMPPPAPVPTLAPLAMQDNSLLKLGVEDGQQPCLYLDGQRIDISQMSPQQRKRLIDLMVMMRPWIESGPVASAKPQGAPSPAPEPPPPAGMAAAAQRATVPPFDSQPVTRTTGPLKLGTGPLTPPEPPASTPTSMVGQIDAILQTRLMGTPLANRGIRLVESTQGGAMVVVGLKRYAGVADVPDPEVQAAIRAAIAEWENKYTPG
ncbi:MAG: hypothetical protein ACM3MF_06155 [Anaerolineae bacterium]